MLHDEVREIRELKAIQSNSSDNYVKKMYIIYFSLTLMKTKVYQRRNIKEEFFWNKESRKHKIMDILEEKEIHVSKPHNSRLFKGKNSIFL